MWVRMRMRLELAAPRMLLARRKLPVQGPFTGNSSRVAQGGTTCIVEGAPRPPAAASLSGVRPIGLAGR